MTIDSQSLAASLRRLARPNSDREVLSALTEVAEAGVDLFGVTGSGIMIVDEQNVPHYVAASNRGGRILETAETDTRQGPCTEAFVTNQVVASRDIATDSRWPALAAATAGHDIRAVLGVPVRLAGAPVGTLDLYRDRPYDWDDTECAAIKRFGDVVGTTLAAAMSAHAAGELAAQLQYALDYRVSIERGIGYLMASQRLDAVTAFNRLRQAARSTRTKIGTVAEQLLATGRLPEQP